MNRTEILEKLNEVFHDVFDNNDIVVTEQTNANDIEEWDSLIHITLISAVEDEFDVSFDMKTVVSMKNVGDMIDASFFSTTSSKAFSFGLLLLVPVIFSQ